MNKIDFSNNEKNKIKGAKFSSLCANIKYKDRLDLILYSLKLEVLLQVFLLTLVLNLRLLSGQKEL